MTGRRLAPILVLLALHLGASAEERISSSQTLCDASFASLRRCSQNLGALDAGSSCCRRLKEFEAQGCTCPGCDDVSDESTVEALTDKGMAWLLELQPLVDACAGDSDDALTGESALHSASLEAPQFVQSVTEVEVQGKGTARVEEISASLPFDDHEAEEDEEDGMLGAWEAVDSTLAALEADSAAAQVNYLADDTAVPAQQQQPWTEGALYEDDDSDDATASSSDTEEEDSSEGQEREEEEEGEEGWAGAEAGSWGVEAAEIEAALHGMSQEATGAELLAAEMLASSEDFPLELDSAVAALGTALTSSTTASSGSEYEERDDGARGQQQAVLPAAASFEQQAEEQGAVKEAAQEVVVSHTRTIALDLEVNPRSVSEAAQVMQQVLDHATSASASLTSSTLRPLSRKVSIDIRLDGSSARPLGQLLATWLPATASSHHPSSAALSSLRSQLEAQLAQQQQPVEATGGACQCVGMELPPSAAAQPSLVYYYLKARLALCQFSCAHRQSITVALLVELTACLALAACILMRRSQRGPAAEAAAYGGEEGGQPGQFVVASAADPEWQKPLLQNEC